MNAKYEIITILTDDEKMYEYLGKRSNLYTSYSVKDKNGKFKSVIDNETVIKIIRELLLKV
jgi:hypothetical protein